MDPKPEFYNPKKVESPKAEQTPGNFSTPEQIKNIQEVFKLNPELGNVGTIEEYSKYLETIFPESKVKEIFYHGSPNLEIDKFLSPKDEGYKQHENTTTGSTGVYFADSLDEAKRYTTWNEGENGQIYPVVLNVQKFFTVAENKLDGLGEGLPKSALWNVQEGMLDVLKNNNVDAFIAGKHMVEAEGFKEIVMLNTDKIYILGSQKDIQKFKEFVSKEKNPAE